MLLSLGILWVTVTDLDPMGEQRSIAFIAFFISLFSGITSFFTFVFFFGNELLRGKSLGSRYFTKSLRRGMLVSIYFTTYMLLEWLNYWGMVEAILLGVFLILVEIIFASRLS